MRIIQVPHALYTAVPAKVGHFYGNSKLSLLPVLSVAPSARPLPCFSTLQFAFSYKHYLLENHYAVKVVVSAPVAAMIEMKDTNKTLKELAQAWAKPKVCREGWGMPSAKLLGGRSSRSVHGQRDS